MSQLDQDDKDFISSELKEHVDTAVRREMGGFKNDMKQDMSDFKKEMKRDITDLKKEMKHDMSDFKKEIKHEMVELKTDIKEHFDDRYLCKDDYHKDQMKHTKEHKNNGNGPVTDDTDLDDETTKKMAFKIGKVVGYSVAGVIGVLYIIEKVIVYWPG